MHDDDANHDSHAKTHQRKRHKSYARRFHRKYGKNTKKSLIALTSGYWLNPDLREAWGELVIRAHRKFYRWPSRKRHLRTPRLHDLHAIKKMITG